MEALQSDKKRGTSKDLLGFEIQNFGGFLSLKNCPAVIF